MGFKVEHISFSYQERKVVKDISLDIEPGFFYGILGPNGCGKSTLIDLLMGHLGPESGAVNYQGKNVRTFSRAELACELALVPQNFYINFPFTAREIVLMGRYPHMPRFSPPSSHDFKIVDDIMEKTGTSGFKNRYMTEMSGGERQRIVFARALAQETPVLLLDEATSNLDIKHTLTMMDIVAQEIKNKGKTAVAVIQDINLAAAYCQRLIIIKQGSIAAFGNTDKVLTADNIKKVFNVDSHIYFDSYSNSIKVSFKKSHEKIFDL
ncbi:putative ABC transporter, ATP-binding protein [Desulfonema limicola]|uniref:ABC transporter, ATP-binding protein n=1 Tax=Desulfonema limicola TaxID=45656 RepID=A0A975GHB9_9BACT|nr:ABC transporter ATP-binding protein [Desulfonema limicola]QTA81255.1 putative ABC transporter, ATP-binding protein [Desulfonema limicola]